MCLNTHRTELNGNETQLCKIHFVSINKNYLEDRNRNLEMLKREKERVSL